MKTLWKIKLKNGKTVDEWTDEPSAPNPGDGHVVNGIPVKVKSHLTTPVSSQTTGYDLAIVAEEQ